MNIFEGSRRILKMVYALSVIVFLGNVIDLIFYQNAVVYATYTITNFGSAPILQTNGSCPNDAAQQFGIIRDTEKGTHVDISLCFLAVDDFGADGEKLIPYKIDEVTGKLWGDEKYSKNVRTYTSKKMAGFNIPKYDFEKFDSMKKTRLLDGIFEYVEVMISVIVGIKIFSWFVGYIVRGFLGIPRKSDAKISSKTEND